MLDHYDFPNAVDMEKQLLSAMFLDEGYIVPKVLSIINADDLYRPEHQFIFNAIVSLYSSGKPVDFLSVEHELQRNGDHQKIDHLYLLSLINATYTTAFAEYHAKIIKEKADLRRLIVASKIIREDANLAQLSPADIIAKAQLTFDQISRSAVPSKKFSFADFFANNFDSEIEQMKNYSKRLSGFDNLDRLQLFNPGLYVIGATPAAGKTTFCWQLLEQLAERGETCIFCSYEMSKLELFAKSLARELFRRVPNTELTAADIRRGAWSVQLDATRADFATSKLDLSVLELQDESVDDLLNLLKPLCSDKAHAPVVCLDYLQIVPSSKDTAKLGIDDSVRKLKKFQHDTNSTFFVISSFNRDNYIRSVSFSSFKESGNIEYTADVVWALQLNVLNQLNFGSPSDIRKQIDDAKKQQPRQIQLKCLKNRHGTNYDCFFNYFSAHDCFVPCENFDNKSESPKKTNSQRRQ
ncbi:MAG: hypothetical protein IJG33_05630 [Selenomonadaceae bacterium]|nr:hypothetical protein [Selenomonadaceae bacterium]